MLAKLSQTIRSWVQRIQSYGMGPKIGTDEYTDHRDTENALGPFEDSSIVSEARWYRNECVSAEWNEDADETIEVTVWHGEKLEAAQICRDYIEYALAEAFGDEYAIDVSVVEESHSRYDIEQTYDDDFESSVFYYLDHEVDQSKKAKDCNIYIAEYINGKGGGDTATCAVYGDRRPGVIDLGIDNCVTAFGNNDQPHYRMNVVLHEVGHCLGFSHEGGDDDGAVVEIDNKSFATPMKTTYANTENVIHRYSRTCREKGPEVQ